MITKYFEYIVSKKIPPSIIIPVYYIWELDVAYSHCMHISLLHETGCVYSISLLIVPMIGLLTHGGGTHITIVGISDNGYTIIVQIPWKSKKFIVSSQFPLTHTGKILCLQL